METARSAEQGSLECTDPRLQRKKPLGEKDRYEKVRLWDGALLGTQPKLNPDVNSVGKVERGKRATFNSRRLGGMESLLYKCPPTKTSPGEGQWEDWFIALILLSQGTSPQVPPFELTSETEPGQKMLRGQSITVK